MRRFLIALVRIYQTRVSVLFPARCKYYPTCSAYAVEALSRHGVIKGLVLTAWRLLRCNPLSDGGVDYPPRAGEWHSSPYHQMSDEELADHWQTLDRAEAEKGM